MNPVHPFDDQWFEDHKDDLVYIGQRKYAEQGRGVIIVEANERLRVGEFVYQYADADAFITRNPDGLGVKWADVIRTYDPANEVVCVLVAGPKGPFVAVVLVTGVNH